MSKSLHEEYIERKGLDIPVFLHKSRSSVILVSKEYPLQWRILLINWCSGHNHPGYYTIDYKSAVHNGYEDKEIFLDLFKCDCIEEFDEVHFDEYEYFLQEAINIIRDDGFVAAPSNEQVLAAWHLFLYVCDIDLSRSMSEEFFRYVADSMRDDLPLESRKAAYRFAEMMIGLELSDAWAYLILPLARYDSEWLINLING